MQLNVQGLIIIVWRIAFECSDKYYTYNSLIKVIVLVRKICKLSGGTVEINETWTELGQKSYK